jgi:cell division protein FtsN
MKEPAGPTPEQKPEPRTPDAPASHTSPRSSSRSPRHRSTRPSSGSKSETRWLVFCGWFVGGWLSWQTPGALSPDLEDLL